MITIVLTGGIGSGKSTVSAVLKKMGAVIIDTDKAAHEVLDTTARPEIIAAFGREILNEKETIDRKKLAQVVFKNPQALARLNKIVHTLLDIEVVNRLQKLKQQGTDIAVVELPLYSEAPWVGLADCTWIVKTDRDVILPRLKDRGLSEAESLARMAVQKPPEESVKGPKVIIENNGSVADLQIKIEKLWQELHNENKKGVTQDS